MRASPSLYEDIGAAEPIDWGERHSWPTLSAAALHGLAGDFVRIVAPHSEADLAGLLVQFLAAFGCSIGPRARFLVEATSHPARVNVLLIGETSAGRKGTSLDRVRRVFQIADAEWLDKAQLSGLASGEGLVARVRDRDDGEQTEKRVLVTESEFQRVLAACSREGSTLSAIVREAFDSGRLQSATRKEPMVATGAHIVIVAHSTADELRADLDKTSMANGFANRFLTIGVRRRQRLPHGGSLDDSALSDIAKNLRTAMEFGRVTDRMHRSAKANRLWEEFYNSVPEPIGLLGAITGRAEAFVLRLSMIYALLDGSATIDDVHLRPALAVWAYSRQSAEYVFGSMLGDVVGERILGALREAFDEDRSGLDREALMKAFSRNVSAEKLTTALDYLEARGLVRREKLRNDSGQRGRPREIAYAVPPS